MTQTTGSTVYPSEEITAAARLLVLLLCVQPIQGIEQDDPPSVTFSSDAKLAESPKLREIMMLDVYGFQEAVPHELAKHMTHRQPWKRLWWLYAGAPYYVKFWANGEGASLKRTSRVRR